MHQRQRDGIPEQRPHGDEFQRRLGSLYRPDPISIISVGDDGHNRLARIDAVGDLHLGLGIPFLIYGGCL